MPAAAAAVAAPDPRPWAEVGDLVKKAGDYVATLAKGIREGLERTRLLTAAAGRLKETLADVRPPGLNQVTAAPAPQLPGPAAGSKVGPAITAPIPGLPDLQPPRAAIDAASHGPPISPAITRPVPPPAPPIPRPAALAPPPLPPFPLPPESHRGVFPAKDPLEQFAGPARPHDDLERFAAPPVASVLTPPIPRLPDLAPPRVGPIAPLAAPALPRLPDLAAPRVGEAAAPKVPRLGDVAGPHGAPPVDTSGLQIVEEPAAGRRRPAAGSVTPRLPGMAPPRPPELAPPKPPKDFWAGRGMPAPTPEMFAMPAPHIAGPKAGPAAPPALPTSRDLAPPTASPVALPPVPRPPDRVPPRAAPLVPPPGSPPFRLEEVKGQGGVTAPKPLVGTQDLLSGVTLAKPGPAPRLPGVAPPAAVVIPPPPPAAPSRAGPGGPGDDFLAKLKEVLTQALDTLKTILTQVRAPALAGLAAPGVAPSPGEIAPTRVGPAAVPLAARTRGAPDLAPPPAPKLNDLGRGQVAETDHLREAWGQVTGAIDKARDAVKGVAGGAREALDEVKGWPGKVRDFVGGTEQSQAAAKALAGTLRDVRLPGSGGFLPQKGGLPGLPPAPSPQLGGLSAPPRMPDVVGPKGNAEAKAPAAPDLSPNLKKTRAAVHDLIGDLQTATARGEEAQEALASVGGGKVKGALNETKAAATGLTASFSQLGVVGVSAVVGIVSGLRSFARAGLEGTGQAAMMSFQMRELARGVASVFLPVIDRAIDVVRRLSDWFRSLSGTQQDALQGLAVGAGVAKIGMMALGGPLGLVAGALAGLLTGTDAGSKALDGLGGAFSGVLNALKPVLSGVSAAMDGILEAVKPALDSVLGVVGDMAGRIGPILGEIVTAVKPVLEAFANIFAGIFESLKPLLGTFADVVKDMVTAIGPVLESVGGIFKDVFAAIKPALDKIVPVLQDLAKTFSEVFAGIMGDLKPILDQLGGVIGQVIGTMAETVAGLVKDNAPLLKELGKAFGDLVKALVPLAEVGVQVLGQFATMGGQLLSTLMPIVGDVAKMFTGLVKDLRPLFDEFGTLFDEVGVVVREVMDEVMSTAKPIIEEMGQAFRGLLEAIKPVVKFLMDHFIASLRQAMAMVEKAIAVLSVLKKTSVKDLLSGKLSKDLFSGKFGSEVDEEMKRIKQKAEEQKKAREEKKAASSASARKKVEADAAAKKKAEDEKAHRQVGSGPGTFEGVEAAFKRLQEAITVENKKPEEETAANTRNAADEAKRTREILEEYYKGGRRPNPSPPS